MNEREVVSEYVKQAFDEVLDQLDGFPLKRDLGCRVDLEVHDHSSFYFFAEPLRDLKSVEFLFNYASPHHDEIRQELQQELDGADWITAQGLAKYFTIEISLADPAFPQKLLKAIRVYLKIVARNYLPRLDQKIADLEAHRRRYQQMQEALND